MKKFNFIFLFFGIIISSYSITYTHNYSNISYVIQTTDTNKIYTDVEKKAEFPRGKKALAKYLTNNINYPTEAKEKNISGRVFVGFVVEKDGSITNVNIRVGRDPLLDAEALRVVKSMPKWKPAKEKGKVVRSKFILPIVFVIQ
ncbi:MAG: energy transducer TonB [Bacteroidales bacterium]|nr:energy transducer TonB [Bacteroidales bacterium]